MLRCLDLASSWTVTYEGFTMCSCPSHALSETNVIPILQMMRKRLPFLRSKGQPGQSWDLNPGLTCSSPEVLPITL